jgi:hypothetical protein
MILHPLSYQQDQRMRKFQSKRFTSEEIENAENDVDTGNTVAYHWNYTVGKTKYTQCLERATGIITITPTKEPIAHE